MSSSSKIESVLESENLSPVRLPGRRTPTSRYRAKELLDKKTPGIMTHPHGISAKHEARRNTIHHHPGSKLRHVETPLIAKSLNSEKVSLSNKISLTSPRASNLKNISLESFRNIRKDLEAKLHGVINKNKENNDPFVSSPKVLETPTKYDDSSFTNGSSPVKRRNNDNHLMESSKKIAKVVTNANEITESSRCLIQVDEVFNKEDIVSKLHADNSPEHELLLSHNSPSVIDNDSESDPEDYGRIEHTFSQTIIPNNNDNTHTQVNKIMKSDPDKDYITPQRLTEPIAKSPITNQQVRINDNLIIDDFEDISKSDSKDITSPLKFHKLLDQEEETFDETSNLKRMEDEPTINFLMSPNSKPVFSVEQISKLQSEHAEEINKIQETLAFKNREILKLNQELSLVTNNGIMIEQEFKEFKQLQKNKTTNEEILSIQLKHNEREFASLTKNFKIKESLINQLELKVTKSKSKIQNLIGQVNTKIEENASLSKKLSNAEELLNNNKQSNAEGQEQLNELKTLCQERESEISKLTSSSLESNSKVEQLLSEKETLLEQIQVLTNSKNSLEEQLEEERDLNLRQEELVKELDKLENLAKDKIHNLEQAIANKNDESEQRFEDYEKLQKDARLLDEQVKSALADIDGLRDENELLKDLKRRLERDIFGLSEKLDSCHTTESELNEKIANLGSDLAKANSIAGELNARIVELEANDGSFSSTIKKLEEENKSLSKFNDEKDKTIIDDTKRMNELVNAIDQQRENYEAKIVKLKEGSSKTNSDIEKLHEENELLKKQVKSLESLLETKILEVATFLHKEYAEKHVKKLRDVKDKYEKELNLTAIERKGLEREIDLLKRKLARANEECLRINEFVHLNKLNYKSGANALSPRRSTGSRSRY
ncbi:uncharacterized protein PRCAT00000580001 [Priceomyces carsonii]|uniref:uncharacterized protein n=1 Tax=Priceomyces carsonii TaxID=28549 RepID=UPI002EDA802A|nr:unnamed protein product [Priceomyces carsonii]